jgi:branched-chain amino acid transport system ATP-binding protein
LASGLLRVQSVSKSFGGTRALTVVDLAIDAEELVGLIGPNGAGKTTLFNIVAGALKPTSGSVTFDGRSLNKLKAHQVARLGIARTFQNIRLFGNLTVLDNVRIACHRLARYSPWDFFARSGRFQVVEKQIRELAFHHLEQLDLSGVAGEYACNLPYGQQRRLEIARALATEPKLLLLDEPSAGMNPRETQELADLIKGIQQRLRIAILLIEHDMSLVMQVSRRICVLNYGEVLRVGTPDEVKSDAAVIEAYLGAAEEC